MEKIFKMFLLCFTIFVFNCKKEENNSKVILEQDFQEANDLLTGARDGFSFCPYTFNECLLMVVDYLKIQPNVIDAGIGQDGTTIIFTHKSGIEGMLYTDLKGYEDFVNSPLQSDFSPLTTFLGYAAIYEAPNFSSLDQDVKNILEKVGFKVDLYLEENFSLESLRNLSKYKTILIISHGGLNRYGDFCFLSGEKVEIPISLGFYYHQGIGIGTYDGAKGNYLNICPPFFDYEDIIFSSGSSLFFCACRSLQNNSLAELLNKRGLGMYLGWTESVQVGCSDMMTSYFFDLLTDGLTIEEIFLRGDKDFGDFGKCDYYDKKKEKEVYVDLDFYPSFFGYYKLDIKTEKGKIGEPCKYNSDCESGVCEKSMPQGYCIDKCFSDFLDCCPQEAWLALLHSYFSDVVGLPVGYCLKKCYSESNCRDGYFCAFADGESFGVCLPNYHDGEWAECGKVFEKLEMWNCAPGMECLRIYDAPSDLGICQRVCDTLNPNCENCFSEINYTVDGKEFCGICCDNCSYLGFEELCGPSGYKDFCPQGTDCFGYEGGEFKCYALCDLSFPDCSAGRYCREIEDYCEGIGGCMP
jgi:hypothetical protein